MTQVPTEKLNELLDEHRQLALDQRCVALWMDLAALVAVYEGEEDGSGDY